MRQQGPYLASVREPRRAIDASTASSVMSLIRPPFSTVIAVNSRRPPSSMITRCREHNLRAFGPERKLLINFTVLLTAKTMHALFGPSRRKWIAL